MGCWSQREYKALKGNQMKKVRFDKEEGCIKKLEDDDFLYCPINNPSEHLEAVECGSWCAWFDIEEKTTITSQADFVAHGFREIKYKIVTCKGTPIAKLTEEENDKVSL